MMISGGRLVTPGKIGSQGMGISVVLLEQYSPDFVAANHCTGFDMMSELRGRFGKKFIPAFVGTVIEF